MIPPTDLGHGSGLPLGWFLFTAWWAARFLLPRLLDWWVARWYMPLTETGCQRCGGPNVVWTAPSPLWNEVMRDGDINGNEEYGIVCPTCFATLAEEKGIAFMWRLHPKRTEVELATVTPSGRVWNPETWLWEKP